MAGNGDPARPDAGDRPRAGRAQTFARIGVPVVIVWALLAGLLILAGEVVEHSAAVVTMDRAVTSFMVTHRTPELDRVMTALTWAGSWIAALSLAAVLGILGVLHRLPALAVVAVLVGWAGEALGITVAKAVVRRPRPPDAVRRVAAHGWSFPSGHTATAVVVFGAIGALLAVRVVRRSVRLLMWALCVLMVALVGVSRIELGVHWTSDVIASLVWTSAWLVTAARAPGVASRWKGSAPPASRRRRDDARPISAPMGVRDPGADPR